MPWPCCLSLLSPSKPSSLYLKSFCMYVLPGSCMQLATSQPLHLSSRMLLEKGDVTTGSLYLWVQCSRQAGHASLPCALKPAREGWEVGLWGQRRRAQRGERKSILLLHTGSLDNPPKVSQLNGQKGGCGPHNSHNRGNPAVRCLMAAEVEIKGQKRAENIWLWPFQSNLDAFAEMASSKKFPPGVDFNA